MRRLSWRLRALYDDEYGRRFDRWFGAGAGLGLLFLGLRPVIFGAAPGAAPIGLFSTFAAVYFLVGAIFWPRIITPFSLLCLALMGAAARLKPGVDRVADVDPKDHLRTDEGAPPASGGGSPSGPPNVP